jgi:hypothetical protein
MNDLSNDTKFVITCLDVRSMTPKERVQWGLAELELISEQFKLWPRNFLK